MSKGGVEFVDTGQTAQEDGSFCPHPSTCLPASLLITSYLLPWQRLTYDLSIND